MYSMQQLEAIVEPCKVCPCFYKTIYKTIQCNADITKTFDDKSQGNENCVKRLKFKVMT